MRRRIARLWLALNAFFSGNASSTLPSAVRLLLCRFFHLGRLDFHPRALAKELSSTRETCGPNVANSFAALPALHRVGGF